MPRPTYALIKNPTEPFLAELRQRGYTVINAYLGDLGYATDDDIELVCEAIDELMTESQEWTPIVWDQLEPEAQRELMLMAADSDTFMEDSDTFMEKGRLMTDWVYEDRINCILDLAHDHFVPCNRHERAE